MLPIKIDVEKIASAYKLSLQQMHSVLQKYFMKKYDAFWGKSDFPELKAKLVWQDTYEFLYITSDGRFNVGSHKEFFEGCQVREWLPEGEFKEFLNETN